MPDAHRTALLCVMAPEVARADAQRLCLSWKHLTLEFRRAGNIMYSYQQQQCEGCLVRNFCKNYEVVIIVRSFYIAQLVRGGQATPLSGAHVQA